MNSFFFFIWLTLFSSFASSISFPTKLFSPVSKLIQRIRDENHIISLMNNGTAAEIEHVLHKYQGRHVAIFVNGIKPPEMTANGKPISSSLSLLHVAALKEEFDIAKVLLRHGADINSRDYSRKTPLHLAIQFKGLVDQLLEHGADPDLADNMGLTSLHYAAKYDYPLESILQKSKNIDPVSVNGKTPLFFTKDSRAAYLLIERGAEVRFGMNGFTPLHYACIYDINSPEMRRRAQAMVTLLMIEMDGDVNVVDSKGNTPLHYAMMSFAKRNRVDGVENDVVSTILQANVDDIRLGSVPVAYSPPWWNGFQRTPLIYNSVEMDDDDEIVSQLPDLLCPVLYDFPNDPVLASDGYTV